MLQPQTAAAGLQCLPGRRSCRPAAASRQASVVACRRQETPAAKPSTAACLPPGKASPTAAAPAQPAAAAASVAPATVTPTAAPPPGCSGSMQLPEPPAAAAPTPLLRGACCQTLHKGPLLRVLAQAAV